MQILASILGLTVVLLSMVQATVIQKRASFGMDTFSGTNCQGFEEFIAVGAVGANSNPFPGPRKSFKVIFTDETCEVILWTGDFSGTKLTAPISSIPVGSCFGAGNGESFESLVLPDCFSGSGNSARAIGTAR